MKSTFARGRMGTKRKQQERNPHLSICHYLSRQRPAQPSAQLPSMRTIQVLGFCTVCRHYTQRPNPLGQRRELDDGGEIVAWAKHDTMHAPVCHWSEEDSKGEHIVSQLERCGVRRGWSKPRLDGLALALLKPRLGQSRQQAVILARLGPAYLVTAWPGSRPEARPGTALPTS
jgi:hypothetical protein